IASVLALIVGLVLLGLKAKKREKAGKKVVIASVVFMTLGIVTCVGASFLPWVNFTAVSSRELFSRNGYVFSFITTGYRTFRTKPSDYDQDKVGTIVAAVDNAGRNSGDVNIGDMNIIVIQVESLIDPLELECVEYERDPMPFLRSLRENYSYGKVTVPIFGGQTVKSEFEFLTGYSINNLPYGYNPYMIHLDDIAVDSFPRYLRTLGFETIGMHDYQGEFFSRNLVYKNLGFDRFVSYEFMAGAQKKELVIWSDDSILLEQMKMALNSSESGKHFIFAVTVQTHGAYPSLDKSEYPMEIRGLEDDPTIEGKLEYYVGQLEQVDNHIRNIVEYFEQRGEPTAIVIYSDHMPTFALDLPGITAENRFEVNFFSWNNMGLKKGENLQMNLYRLSTYLCDEIGLNGSFMNRFHRLYYGYDNYSEYFEKIQYYKLFEEPETVTYTNDNFELGLTDLRITEITYDAELDEYTIRGEGMTDDAYLCVNGRIYGLVYVDPHTVKYTQPKRKLSEEDTITLRIIGEKYGEVLKESDVYEWG
ncbi:MAG: LTA synthase family protein, partial [Clostridia bacterium]|nr:LTA synthase family protein [Clostridia bacterium]